MANIIQAIELRAKERNLVNEIPLPAPYALYLEPTSLCNMRCAFCPTGDRNLRKQRRNGVMPWELFEKIVGDIADMGVKLKRINLYKDGDPLVHPRFPEMVRRLKAAHVSESLWTKTNALALSPEMNARLVDCGLDMLGISIQAVSEEGYLRVADTKLNFAQFVANIADLFNRRTFTLYIKIADSGLSESDKQRFYDVFGPISDYTAIEQLHGWANSDVKDFTLGTNPTTFEGYPLTDKIVCPLPFFMLGINWNGTVSLCNEDFLHKTLVGDLNETSLKAIWEGDALKRMRVMHLEGRRSENVMCANCWYMRTLPDNLDDKRGDILRRLNA
jgi:radical SAM protein with 4Fe4S-binding SPASM domain